jgi:hypothetical protein
MMKKLGFGILASLMFCLQSHAAIDLYSNDPQPLQEDSAKEVYSSLAKEVTESCDGQNSCMIHLKNFSCESHGVMGFVPDYTCSFGKSSSFTGDNAQRIYEALVQAGFASDCDREFNRSCDIDMISDISCKVSRTSYSELAYSCVIAI